MSEAATGYQAALDTALRLLSRRQHTRWELMGKLKKRGLATQVIDAVLAECERLGYVDDDRSARSYARELQRKGYGRYRIRLAMKRKGLDDRLIEETLVCRMPDTGEIERPARPVKRNGAISTGSRTGESGGRKIYRFLYARGFSASVISEMVTEFMDGKG